MRDDQARLHDILEAIELIERHTNQGRNTFEQQELLQTWIVHHLLKLQLLEIIALNNDD